MRSRGALPTRTLRPPRLTEPPTSRAVSAAVLRMVPRTVGVLALLLAGSALGGLDQNPLAPPVERATDQPRAAQHSASQPASAQSLSPGSVSKLWKPAYSERYPGCVPAVLWPADEQPVALVTMTPDGRVHRVALDEQRHLVRPVPAAARTIGACR